ncbi:sensor histidine kinase [Aidingimonas lacisalsi]|uniref:sensor histidine kinase n=1 Tax=Aidingimonas lacisalsi TaxID=2604086 RepID=UPI0011D1CAF3|nr:HAMP domain-containing sensor histidine kinase [Aidingimonas lacisalsi]
MRLRNIIILTVIVPLFAILLVFSLVAIKSLEDNVRSKLQNEVQIITHAIGTTLSYSLDNETPEAMQEALHSAFSFHRIYGAYVFDESGDKIYGLGLGEELFEPEDIHAVAESGEQTGAYREHERWNYYSTLMPLTSPDGEVRGVLQVNRLNTGIENYTGFISLVAVAVFTVGAAGIVLMIWWGFRRHIERPLNRLLGVMERVEQGDREHRASVEGPEEYRQLSIALNGMLNAMAEKDADIEARQQKEIELEQRLRKSKKLAELGVLAAGVAHEIGAPLTVINGQAQRLTRSEHMSEDEQAKLQRIRSEVDRIVVIVRQLMDLGRQHNVEKESCRIGELVSTALELLEEEMDTHTPRLDIDLPEPEPEIVVNGQQLIQVITNLLHNALQATPSGHVRIQARVEGNEVNLRIEDDGPGIDDDVKNQVFDPFYTTKSVGQGSGLGLSMVHRIVNDHGGTIGVFDSDLGGAGFDITLPMDSHAAT